MNFVHANELSKLRAEHNLSESNSQIQNLEYKINDLKGSIDYLNTRIVKDCAIGMIFVVGIAATLAAYFNNSAE